MFVICLRFGDLNCTKALFANFKDSNHCNAWLQHRHIFQVEFSKHQSVWNVDVLSCRYLHTHSTLSRGPAMPAPAKKSPIYNWPIIDWVLWMGACIVNIHAMSLGSCRNTYIHTTQNTNNSSSSANRRKPPCKCIIWMCGGERSVDRSIESRKKTCNFLIRYKQRNYFIT